MKRIGVPVLLAVTAVALLAVTLVLPPAPAERTNGPVVVEVAHVVSLGEMVASADAIVEGRVIQVSPGRTVSGPIDEGDFQFTNIELEVTKLLSGTAPSAKIVLEEDGILADLSRVGDAGVYFLVRKRDRVDAYRLMNTQARYLVDDEGHLIASALDDPLSSDLASLTLDELRTAVRKESLSR